MEIPLSPERKKKKLFGSVSSNNSNNLLFCRDFAYVMYYFLILVFECQCYDKTLGTELEFLCRLHLSVCVCKRVRERRE